MPCFSEKMHALIRSLMRARSRARIQEHVDHLILVSFQLCLSSSSLLPLTSSKSIVVTSLLTGATGTKSLVRLSMLPNLSISTMSAIAGQVSVALYAHSMAVSTTTLFALMLAKG
jgi:hypothetical protein